MTYHCCVIDYDDAVFARQPVEVSCCGARLGVIVRYSRGGFSRTPVMQVGTAYIMAGAVLCPTCRKYYRFDADALEKRLGEERDTLYAPE